jgi:hypothetical protein
MPARLGSIGRLALPAVLVAAVVFVGHWWTRPPHWSPDGLFYEAQRLEVAGASAQDARTRVFFADPGYRAARDDAFPPQSPTRTTLLNHRWVDYSAANYRRRWAVPAAAEAVSPLFGERSLLIVSLVGYVVLAALLYLWLRLRFGALVSVAVTVVTLSLPPLREWSFIPLTDSWGLAVMLAAFYAAHRVLARPGKAWLVAFAAATAALSFTRDDGIVVIVATLAVALLYGRGRAWWLAAAAVASTLPAVLAFGVPASREAAYVLNGYQPAHGGWGFVARHYPRGLANWLSHDKTYVLAHAGVAVFFAVGLLLVLAHGRATDDFARLAVGAAIGGIVFLLLIVNPPGTAFRLELVLLPAAASGIGYGAAAAFGYVQALRRRAS